MREQKKKTSHWTKNEEEMLRDNYEKLEWEEILKLVPKKDGRQIVKKAEKLGLPSKEKEFTYYDPEEQAWVHTTKIYGVGTVSNVYHAPPDSIFEEVEEKYISNFIKVINEKLVSPKYGRFLSDTGLPHSDETYFLFYELMFKTQMMNQTIDDFPDIEERIRNLIKHKDDK